MKQLIFTSMALAASGLVFVGCQPQTGALNAKNSNANVSNSIANSFNSNTSNAKSNSSFSAVEAKEPEQYAATVKLTLEALGEEQKALLPAVTALVARHAADRRMELALPNGEKVIYLDTAGSSSSYVILPNRRQYAELTQQAVGFEVRKMLMPEQIVNQVKSTAGVQRVGEETINGRKVVRYNYAATTNTQTRAGQVATESFLLIDSETGLPLRSETVSQSQTGGNVQGYKGMKLVTEMTDIKLNPEASLFTVPSDYAKIDPEQVKSQVSLIFNAIAAFAGQAMQQQTAPVVSPSPGK